MIRFFFSILSIVYVSAIFFLAGSPMVQELSTFNPHSLLHVPLYGTLTVLLIFSLVPTKIDSIKPIDLKNSVHPMNPTNLTTHFLLAGLIALAVGIADEIHQAYVPGRDASVTDVFLDLVGIIIVLFLIRYLYKKRIFRKLRLHR